MTTKLALLLGVGLVLSGLLLLLLSVLVHLHLGYPLLLKFTRRGWHRRSLLVLPLDRPASTPTLRILRHPYLSTTMTTNPAVDPDIILRVEEALETGICPYCKIQLQTTNRYDELKEFIRSIWEHHIITLHYKEGQSA